MARSFGKRSIFVTLLLQGDTFVEASQRLEAVLHASGSAFVNKGGGHGLFSIHNPNLTKEEVDRMMDKLAGDLSIERKTIVVGEDHEREMQPA